MSDEPNIPTHHICGLPDFFSGAQEPIWWYLSFTDADKPKGSQWLGSCIVKACCEQCAVIEAHRRGCNPGGEVMIAGGGPDPKPGHENKLLTTKAEVEAAYGDPPGSAGTIADFEHPEGR